MNKTTKIILVVILLILLGGGVFYFLGRSSSSPLKSVQDQIMQGTTQKKSLFDFFSMGGSQKCTFSDKTNNSSGTVYVGNGKMRGDFQSNDNGTTSQTHMINDGKYVYMWTEGQKDGYKMSLDTIKQQAAQESSNTGNTPSDNQTPSQAVNMNQKADYSCGGWSVDSSLFTVPSDVNFVDYSAMMQGAMKGVTPPTQTGTGMTKGQQQSECAQCNQVPAGAMRNQCLSALKCQ